MRRKLTAVPNRTIGLDNYVYDTLKLLQRLTLFVQEIHNPCCPPLVSSRRNFD